MTSVQQSTLSVPGASLFYRSCGRGAPLLILAGGGADADMTDPLRDRLATRHRVIVGPFSSSQETQRAISQLRKQDVDALVLARKPTAG